MLKLLKLEIQYYWVLMLALYLVSAFFSIMFYLFEPPEWDKVFAILFIGPMTFGAVIIINRANQMRDHFYLLMPLKHYQVFIGRTLFLLLLVYGPFVFATVAFWLRGTGAEAVEQLAVAVIARGFIVVSVFQIQMDVSMKRMGARMKVVAAALIAAAYILIVWVLVYLGPMTKMLNKIGAGFMVDYVIGPLGAAFSEQVVFIVACLILVFNYYIFTQERHPREMNACRRI
jgi:hypothetical protein